MAMLDDGWSDGGGRFTTRQWEAARLRFGKRLSHRDVGRAMNPPISKAGAQRLIDKFKRACKRAGLHVPATPNAVPEQFRRSAA